MKPWKSIWATILVGYLFAVGVWVHNKRAPLVRHQRAVAQPHPQPDEAHRVPDWCRYKLYDPRVALNRTRCADHYFARAVSIFRVRLPRDLEAHAAREFAATELRIDARDTGDPEIYWLAQEFGR